MRVLGIDPGLVKTGWGAVEMCQGTVRVLDYGMIQTLPSSALPQRLAFLHNALKPVIQGVCPHRVALEKTLVNRNARSSLHLGFARGVCLMTAGLCDMPVFECAPTHLKKQFVGTGKATKAQIQFMVKTELSLHEELTEDISDALALAILCIKNCL